MENQSLDYSSHLLAERFKLDPETYKNDESLPNWSKVIHELKMAEQHKSLKGVFKNLIVIPKGELNGVRVAPIFFSQDSWSVDWYPEARNMIFNNLMGRLKFEAKVFAMAELWLFNRESKLPSLTRKCKDIILVAEKCAEIGILSLTHLSQPSLRDKLYHAFREKNSHDTTRNKFIAIVGLSDAHHTPLKDYGLSCSENVMSDIGPRQDGNQTYAMPFSIMSQMWQGHKHYAISIREEYLKYALPIVEMIALFNHESAGVGKDISHVTENIEWVKLIGQPKFQELLRLYNDRFPEYSDVYNRSTAVFKNNDRSTQSRERRIAELGVIFTINIMPFSKRLHEISNILHLGIQTFTGMRASESADVSYGSLVIDRVAEYIGVDSNRYKFAPEGGVKDVWAAAPWVEECFITANMIAKALFAGMPDEKVNDITIIPNIGKWLTRQELKQRKGRSNKEFVTPTTIVFSEKYQIKITDEDVKEFFRLNRNINDIERLRNEIKAGELWPIRSHQFRRSIAVHTKRLGAASDRALSFQLKHRQRAQTAWYSDGGVENSVYNSKIAEKLYKLWSAEEDTVMAEASVELQESKNLFGRGGEILKRGQKNENAKVYPSIKKAKQMAIRGKNKLKALGNGMYCLEGEQCSMGAVMQASSCNFQCENLAADEDAITYHHYRFKYYNNLLDNSISHSRTEAQIEYLRLEMESHKEFLEYFGVLNRV